MNYKNTFGKKERLKSRKQIDYLFAKGKSFHAHPLKVLFAKVDEGEILQAGVAVSSRNFKRAVDRNRVKRVVREVYRVQKAPLQEMLQIQDEHLILFFIYVGKELPVYADVHEKMETLIKRITASIAIKKEVE